MDSQESELIQSLKLIHEVLENKPSVLKREHHSKLEALYYLVPGLDFIPKRLWTKVNEMLQLKTIRKGKNLINYTMMNPPCYIILTGTLEMSMKYQTETTQIKPGDTFGDYYLFNDKRWRASNVSAIEDSSVAEFPSESLYKLIVEENSNQQFRLLINFLKDSIIGFEFLSRHSQERLARFFRERTFYPGQLLFKEQTPSISAIY